MVMKGEQFPADLVLLASSSRWILRISTRDGYAVLLNIRRSNICAAYMRINPTYAEYAEGAHRQMYLHGQP